MKVNKLINKVQTIIWNLLKFFIPVRKNRIVANNFFGNGYGDNPKFIYEELLKTGKFELYWITKEINSGFPKEIKQIKINSWKEKYVMASSKMRISNIRNYFPIKLKKKQLYFQTWHGGLGIKPVEHEVEKKLDKKYLKWSKYDGKKCTGFLAPSAEPDNYYRELFWLNNDCEILNFGSIPRDEYLYNNNNEEFKQILFGRYGLDSHYSYVLYAPTFRDDAGSDYFKLDFLKIKESFEKLLKKKCKIIVRPHPNDAKRFESITFSNDILNGSSFNDSQDLTILCDSLVSDYSSIVFDFIKLGKTYFLYTPDEKEYKESRGLNSFYFELNQKKNKSFDELIDDIQTSNLQTLLKTIQKEQKEFHLSYTPNSSKKIVEWISNKLLKQ